MSFGIAQAWGGRVRDHAHIPAHTTRIHLRGTLNIIVVHHTYIFSIPVLNKHI